MRGTLEGLNRKCKGKLIVKHKGKELGIFFLIPWVTFLAKICHKNHFKLSLCLMENIIADTVEISFSEQCTRFSWTDEALGISMHCKEQIKERITLPRQPRAAKPHPLLCTQMLRLHFVAMQKAQQLITVNYNLRFPLNIPEKADLKIHWQEHSSHSRSGSPPEWGVRAGREEKERGRKKPSKDEPGSGKMLIACLKQGITKTDLIKTGIYHYLNQIWSRERKIIQF